ncbi:MAG: RNA polymerase sigma factor, partial [Gammaproteobacteria bacterium]|nr:RNA polymerase sigma factor [Gammaproteobacteria bacterium]NIT62362.1 RNA polymerase sigma factor [Gammaproteobacteria bacterium]NIY30942.1 sigma-70 family RNA polymerase sigma factor [Gammaproteobacteria bacterium]
MALPATATDAEVIRHIRRGGTEGMARLVDRYSPQLYRYLRHWVNDTQMAEDILQDTWLRVVERLDRYDARRPFLAWLLAIARHRAIDLLRQRARQASLLGGLAEPQVNEEGDPLEPLDRVAAGTPSPLEQLAEADLQHRVGSVLSSLPAVYREALTLRFHEDLQLEEIARLLRVPLSTVKSRVQRGLLLL